MRKLQLLVILFLSGLMAVASPGGEALGALVYMEITSSLVAGSDSSTTLTSLTMSNSGPIAGGHQSYYGMVSRDPAQFKARLIGQVPPASSYFQRVNANFSGNVLLDGDLTSFASGIPIIIRSHVTGTFSYEGLDTVSNPRFECQLQTGFSVAGSSILSGTTGDTIYPYALFTGPGTDSEIVNQDIVAEFLLNPANPTFSLSSHFILGASVSRNAFGDADFSNSAGLLIELPEGVNLAPSSDVTFIPEPASALLMTFGLMGLAARKRRKLKS